jgi:hypothetical protein
VWHGDRVHINRGGLPAGRAPDREQRAAHEIFVCLIAAAEQVSGAGAVSSVLVLDEDGLLRNGASPNLPADYLRAIDGLKPTPSSAPARRPPRPAAWSSRPVFSPTTSGRNCGISLSPSALPARGACRSRRLAMAGYSARSAPTTATCAARPPQEVNAIAALARRRGSRAGSKQGILGARGPDIVGGLVAGEGCLLCAPRPESNDHWDLIATLSVSSLYLAKNQTYRGQCQLTFDPATPRGSIELTPEDTERLPAICCSRTARWRPR